MHVQKYVIHSCIEKGGMVSVSDMQIIAGHLQTLIFVCYRYKKSQIYSFATKQSIIWSKNNYLSIYGHVFWHLSYVMLHIQ